MREIGERESVCVCVSVSVCLCVCICVRKRKAKPFSCETPKQTKQTRKKKKKTKNKKRATRGTGMGKGGESCQSQWRCAKHSSKKAGFSCRSFARAGRWLGLRCHLLTAAQPQSRRCQCQGTCPSLAAPARGQPLGLAAAAAAAAGGVAGGAWCSFHTVGARQ